MNPKLTVFPIGAVAYIGCERGIPLAIDDTLLSGLGRPREYGANDAKDGRSRKIAGKVDGEREAARTERAGHSPADPLIFV